MRNRLRRAAIATFMFFAATLGPSATAQSDRTADGRLMPISHIDTLTRLPVYLLPGEKAYTMRNGCRGIVRTLVPDYTSTDWHGGCLFGLLHGGGSTTYYYKGKPSEYEYKKLILAYPHGSYYYGRVLPAYSGDTVAFPASDTRSADLQFTVTRKIRPLSNGDFQNWKTRDLRKIPHVLNPNGTETSFYAVYRNEAEEFVTKRFTIEVKKLQCRVDGYGKKAEIVANPVKGALYDTQSPFELFKAIEARVFPYCQASLKQRLKTIGADGIGGWYSFNDLDYGYFFVVVQQRIERPASGGGFIKIESIDLCPVFTDVNSCEPIWRAKAEPYFREFEELKPVVRRERAQLIADLDRLYAPLRIAMRRRAKELKLP